MYQFRNQNYEFQKILRNKKIELVNSQKWFNNKLKRFQKKENPIDNPQKKFDKYNPKIDELQHYSESQFSLQHQQKKHKFPRVLPDRSKLAQIEESYMDEDEIKRLRAVQFIKRMRKQREYDSGRAVIRKNKLQKQRQLEELAEIERKSKQNQLMKNQRKNKMISNIFFHQQKAITRLESLQKSQMKKVSYRSRTSASQQHSQPYPQSPHSVFSYDNRGSQSRLPVLFTIRKRLDHLTNMVRSLAH